MQILSEGKGDKLCSESGNTDRETLIQYALEKTHQNISELYNYTTALVESINRSCESCNDLLLLLSEANIEQHAISRHSSINGVDQLTQQSLRDIAQTTPEVSTILDRFANDGIKCTLEKIKKYTRRDVAARDTLPSELCSRKMTPDELIYTLKWLPVTKTTKRSREKMLRKNIIEAHFELANAIRFHKQLHETHDLPEIANSVRIMTADRIIRTKRILSKSIRELVAIDKMYEDFFYEYLITKKLADFNGVSHSETQKARSAEDIQAIITSHNSKTEEEYRRSNEERLKMCAEAMGSLMKELINMIQLPASNTAK
ncbi:uncharacterized protein BXIN_0773 [Babesia sp. Xinjiang]|uniref:uncharacterized protein n=1 Tax=Babesia sp. Xinjiang TaxID=462227 RepID=UPI000A24926F|nr:uncharacterized protein BXIN_0773 [Babesia sp. Xinjiang]ORM41332.1 hypothetical protein BXIN_0773 [Babesia sp. Xinjiang]